MEFPVYSVVLTHTLGSALWYVDKSSFNFISNHLVTFSLFEVLAKDLTPFDGLLYISMNKHGTHGLLHMNSLWKNNDYRLV